jgi:hypothetical protein
MTLTFALSLLSHCDKLLRRAFMTHNLAAD